MRFRGLSRRDATAPAGALEHARTRWWRNALATDGGAVVATAARLLSLSRPGTYVRRRAFEALRDSAAAAAAPFPGSCPNGMPERPELAALERIRVFLADPDAARSTANEVFVADELGRSRTFLDSVGSRPLTDEQRRAVVVDDDRNLVVAAAGSGKTSVMVAKAGWLMAQGARASEELLLLAFGRKARDELADRVGRRLRTAARDMNVRTFHELGLAIISCTPRSATDEAAPGGGTGPK